LAVRQLGGGQAVPAKQDLFTKGLKKPLQTAVEKGWIRSDKADVATVGKTGKTKTARQDVLVLTPEGEQAMRQACSPEVLAAAQAGQLQAFKAGLEADRHRLRQDIVEALAKKGKSPANPAVKEMTALSKMVSDLARRLEKIESHLNDNGADPVLQHFDQAFARLEARLGQTASSLPPASNPAGTQTAGSVSVRKALKQAYDQLCLLIEFEDRLVPLPRLFHQARTTQPGLTVQAFHRELEDLWSQRQLELQVLNEVRTASEPDKAIRRGDDLFYYVLWH
jgi:hypothetical protein